MRVGSKAAVVGIGLALALTGCGNAPKQDAPANDAFPTAVPVAEQFDENGEFTLAVTLPPSSFDPRDSSTGLDQNYLAPIYDRLIYLTPDGELEPMLATEWTPSDDGTSLTVKLRSGLAFSDGTPFNADAVKTNLDRYRGEGSKLSQELRQVTNVTVVDDSTVKITVSDGLGALTSSLSARAGMIASPKAITDGTLSSTPVGVGPYKVVTATPGQGLTLERTPGYWQPEVQRVATLEVIGIPDSQTRYNALSTGEISAATVAIDQAKSADEAGMTLVAGPTPLIYFLAVNTASEPFDDPKVREAMSLAINREDIAAGLYEGFCDPQVQLFPKDTIGYSEKIGDGLDQWPYDPEKAKQLVEEAGVSATSTFDANVTAGDTVALAEVLQNQLGEVGINMNVKPGPSATLLEEFAFAKTSPLTVSGYTGPPDPAGVIDRNFLPTALYNPGEAVYDEMLALGQDAASATDPSERNALYGQFTEVFLEEVRNIIPICLLHQIVAAGPAVSGVHAPTDYVDLRNIAISS